MKWLKDFLGCNDHTGYSETAAIPKATDQEGISSDLAMEIGLINCFETIYYFYRLYIMQTIRCQLSSIT
jgi:hypothetical protein